MKKFILVLSFSMLFLLTGCMKADRYAHFSKVEQTLSWSQKQERSFGDSDYSDVTTEKAAVDLLEKKYQLDVPYYYGKIQKILEKQLSSETVHLNEPLYSIFARNKELAFQTILPFYKNEQLQVIVKIDLTYDYSVEQKTVYLKSQIVTIKIAQRKGQLPQDNLSELIHEIGKNMHLSETVITAGLTKYDQKIQANTGLITDDYLPIISNTDGLDKSKEFLKEIAVSHDQDGTLREIYAEISDQM